MPEQFKELPDTAEWDTTTLKLLVRNHSGTLSHVAGLFSRRAFNMDAVLVVPREDNTSWMWLRVAERRRLPQVIAQLEKLEDVLDVKKLPHDGPDVFDRVSNVLGEE